MPKSLPRSMQRIPDGQGIRRVQPDLVAEVAGVAGARDGHRLAGEHVRCHAEELDAVHRRLAAAIQHRARLRSLQRERGHLLGALGDGHVHADRVHVQPAQRRFGGGEAEAVLVEARHRAVVEQLAFVVAPAGVVHLSDGELGDVARHDPIEQPRGVGALDQVLHQRRDVDQRRVVADRPVLALEAEVVGPDRNVPGPAPPVLRQAERGGARMERRALQLVQVGHWPTLAQAPAFRSACSNWWNSCSPASRRTDRRPVS